MKLVTYPHNALRRPAAVVTAIDSKIRSAAAAMLELMYESKGIGLAAPQVTLPYQLVVINPTGDPLQREHEGAFVNPVIVDRKGSIKSQEGCLSFSDVFQRISRAKTVTVHAYNLNGETVEIVATDLISRLWQHEIDHLHGILFVDSIATQG